MRVEGQEELCISASGIYNHVIMPLNLNHPSGLLVIIDLAVVPAGPDVKA